MSSEPERSEPRGIPGAPLLLDVRDIKTHFRTSRGLVRAVDGVSLTLERGKALGGGRDRVGKDHPVPIDHGPAAATRATSRGSGEVLFEGENISELSERDHASAVGNEMAMIFQDPMTSLNPLMKIGKQIAEPLQIHLGMSKQMRWPPPSALLQDVRIPEAREVGHLYPHEMSGGMRQRVMIAIATGLRTDLLFADEPTTALDVTVQAQILDLLDEQRAERNMSLILVTHDLGVVAGHTDESL